HFRQVSSIAQVVGVILCLNAAAKISHRAQGIAALASRWHALASCGPDDRSNMRFSHSNGNLEAASSLMRSTMLFVILSTNVVKLIGFTKDDDSMVEVDRGRMLHPLQAYDRTSQEFHNVGISADGGSFFIGSYKDSLILLNV
nr:hypothetical protein CTI12_AA197050 [Tanacetum cinerariifolium]